MQRSKQDPRIVEIVGETDAKKCYLDYVYDQSSETFFAPIPHSFSSQEKIKNYSLRDFTGSGKSIAILDTGLLTHHPYINERLLESIDFTNTGCEDKNGHGTLVGLLALWASPDVSLYNVKVLNDYGSGTSESLIEGIKWAISRNASIISISAGIQSKKWFRECKGTCDVCLAAEEATKQGIIVCAASGNKPDITYCPATLGVNGGSIMAIEAMDMESFSSAPYSGNGNISAPAGGYLLQKIVK